MFIFMGFVKPWKFNTPLVHCELMFLLNVLPTEALLYLVIVDEHVEQDIVIFILLFAL